MRAGVQGSGGEPRGRASATRAPRLTEREDVKRADGPRDDELDAHARLEEGHGRGPGGAPRGGRGVAQARLADAERVSPRVGQALTDDLEEGRASSGKRRQLPGAPVRVGHAREDWRGARDGW